MPRPPLQARPDERTTEEGLGGLPLQPSPCGPSYEGRCAPVGTDLYWKKRELTHSLLY